MMIYLNVFIYSSSLKPTTTVFPDTSVGARKFPVGPSIFSIKLESLMVAVSNFSTFFPLATISVVAADRSSWALSAPSFFDAEIASLGMISFASKNLAALVQLVHPFLK